MSNRYNNTKRPKPKENLLRNLKRALGPGQKAAGVTYLWEYTQNGAASSP